MPGKPWTPAQIRKLRKLYPHEQTKLVARAMRMPVHRVNNKAWHLGLHKTLAFLRSDAPGRLTKLSAGGRAHRYPKGHQPWNAGLKGWQAGGRAKLTQFKKGNKPGNWRPVGSYRITKDGIRQRKVTDTGYPPRDWKAVHAILWERHMGPIPRGHIVRFKDGDRTNIRLSNLELVSRADNMRRNTYHRYPKEIARMIQLRGALQRQINKREGKHEQHDKRSS